MRHSEAMAMARAAKPKYRVLTWDAELQRFTPQLGVKPGPYTRFGLRKPLRKLQTMGYSADRNDYSVLVERIDVAREGRPARGKVVEE